MIYRCVLAMLLWVCFFGVTPADAEVPVVNESFEALDVGSQPSWPTNLKSQQIQIESGSSRDGMAPNLHVLHVQPTGFSEYWAIHINPDQPLAGQLVVRYKVMFPEKSQTDIKLLFTGSASQGPYIRMRPGSSDAAFGYYDTAHHTVMKKIIPKHWYQVVLKVDVPAKTYSIQVSNLEHSQANIQNQQVLLEGLEFSQLNKDKGEASEFDRISFSRVRGDNANFFLDDVEVRLHANAEESSGDAPIEP